MDSLVVGAMLLRHKKDPLCIFFQSWYLILANFHGKQLIDLLVIFPRFHFYIVTIEVVDVLRGSQLVDGLHEPGVPVLEPHVVLIDVIDALGALQLERWHGPLERRRSITLEHAGRSFRSRVRAGTENQVLLRGTRRRRIVLDG